MRASFKWWKISFISAGLGNFVSSFVSSYIFSVPPVPFVFFCFFDFLLETILLFDSVSSGSLNYEVSALEELTCVTLLLPKLIKLESPVKLCEVKRRFLTVGGVCKSFKDYSLEFRGRDPFLPTGPLDAVEGVVFIDKLDYLPRFGGMKRSSSESKSPFLSES